MAFLQLAFIAYLMQLPLFIVWLRGVASARRLRGRHPEVARLLLLALGLLIAIRALDPLVSLFLPDYLHQQGLDVQETVAVLRTKQAVLAVVGVVPWALTIWGAFGWRERAAAPVAQEGPPP